METDKFVKSLLTLRENFQQYAKMYDSSIELLLQAATMKDNESKRSVPEPLTDNQAALLKYVSNVEDCIIVESMLSHCENNQDLIQAIENLDAEGYIDWNDMNKASFRVTILPILGFETTSESIRQLMIRYINKYSEQNPNRIRTKNIKI